MPHDGDPERVAAGEVLPPQRLPVLCCRLVEEREQCRARSLLQSAAVRPGRLVDGACDGVQFSGGFRFHVELVHAHHMRGANTSHSAAHVVAVTDNTLRIRLLSKTATTPIRAHDDDAGLDLIANEHAYLLPGHHALVGTGIAIALPPGTVGMVCPRSGLAAKQGVTVLNAPGIIDSGYRGEVKVILINRSVDGVGIAPGDRIAQLVIAPFIAPAIDIVTDLDDTTRGTGGFGSTGVSTPASGGTA